MREHADALVTLATELGNPFRRALGELYLGQFDSVVRDRPEGIARMQRALAEFRATGALTMVSCFLSLIAHSQGCFGHYAEAFVAIREALTPIEQTGERAYQAEVHRIHGELLLAENPSSAAHAEESFRTAIDIARRQKAKIMGAACDDKSGSIVGRHRSPGRGARDARWNLLLVHRGL